MSHTFPPPRVLVAADFSNLSQRALEYAGEMLALTGGQGVLVHVADALAPPIPPGSTLAPARKRELLDERNALLRADLLRDVELYSGDPGRWEVSVAEGEPGPVLARVAVERDCRLIILGSHGRGGLQRLLVGSVADHLVRHAHCPVLVMK